MTHVMGVGTVADLTARDSVAPTFSGAIAAIAISTVSGGNADIAVGTVILTMIATGVVAGRHS